MKVLVFSNPKACVPRNMFAILGATSKADDVTKVGRWGSGSKFSIPALWRITGQTPRVYGRDQDGEYVITYRIEPGASYGIPQDVLVTEINGQPAGGLVTVTANESWSRPVKGDDERGKLFKAIREWHQNHIIDGAKGTRQVLEVDNLDGARLWGDIVTVIPFDHEGALDYLLNNHNEYFLDPEAGKHWSEFDYYGTKCRIKRQSARKARLFAYGMLAGVAEHPCIFTPDCAPSKDSGLLDEERVISDHYSYRLLYARALYAMDNIEWMVELFRWLDSDPTSLEKEALANVQHWSGSTAVRKPEKWKEAFEQVYGERTCMAGASISNRYCQELGWKVVGMAWPAGFVSHMKAAGILGADQVVTPKDMIKWAPMTVEQEKIVEQARTIAGHRFPDYRDHVIRVFEPDPDAPARDGMTVTNENGTPIIGLSSAVFTAGTDKEVLQKALGALISERGQVVKSEDEGARRFVERPEQALAAAWTDDADSTATCEVEADGARIRLPDDWLFPAVDKVLWSGLGGLVTIWMPGFGTFSFPGLPFVKRLTGTSKVIYKSKGRYLAVPVPLRGAVPASVVRLRREV